MPQYQRALRLQNDANVLNERLQPADVLRRSGLPAAGRPAPWHHQHEQGAALVLLGNAWVVLRHDSHPSAAQVDYAAKTEYDMVNNYKVLQAGLTKAGVDKVRTAPHPHCV